MSPGQSINVGIVGLGWPGERHAETLNGSTLGNVYAACDVNAERLKAFAEVFGPKQIFTSYEKMLLDPELLYTRWSSGCQTLSTIRSRKKLCKPGNMCSARSRRR